MPMSYGTFRINGRRSDHFSEASKSGGLAVDAGEKPFLLALGYPKELLVPLGEDIARRLHLEFRSGSQEQMKDVQATFKANSKVDWSE